MNVPTSAQVTLFNAPVHFVSAYALTWFANWIGSRKWRRAIDQHWTERARLLWPVQVTAATNLFVVPVLVDLAHRLLSPETTGHWVIAGLAAWLGGLLATYPIAHGMFPELRFGEWLSQTAAGWCLRLSGWIPLIAAGLLMPLQFSWRTVALAGGCLAFHSAMLWGLAVQC